MLRKTAVLIILGSILAGGASSAVAMEDIPKNTHTLTDIYQMALDRSEQVGISKEALYIADQTRKKAFSVLVPELSAFGSHTRYEMTDAASEYFISPESQTTWGLSASQSFTLNGKELIALKITAETIEKSEMDLRAVKEEFLFGVAAAYVDVLQGMKALDIAKASVERLTTYRDSVSVRMKLEEVPKTDMLRAEAELSSAAAQKIAAENRLKYSRAVLAQLAGLDGDYTLEEIAGTQAGTIEQDLSHLKDTAYDHRAELKSMENQKEIAADQVRYYKSGYWPKVTVEGSYSKTEQAPASAFVFNNENLSVGLSVNVPLFDGGLKRAQINESLAQKRQADLQYSALRKQIALEVEKAYLSVISAEGARNAFKDQVTFAGSNYDAVLKQFKFGLANSVDVMDANTVLVTAERQLSDAEYSYQLANMQLARAQGIFLNMLEQDGIL